jgi:plastocyanin
MRVGRLLAATATAVLGICTGASAAAHEVAAAGNVFTGGLAFEPASVSAKVGDTVSWTNTDFLVPHTATEDHGLWDLTGTYGQTPVNPSGFGPGESRQRVFEAGTFSYFCEVHPVDMKGVISVAPKVKRLRAGNRARMRVTWAPGPPEDGQVYDVQRKRSGGWRTVRKGTLRPAGTFPGTTGRFRARLRLASDPSAASGYSPAAGR